MLWTVPDQPPAAVSAPPSATLEQVGAEVGEAMKRGDWRRADLLLSRLPPETSASPEVRFVRAFLARRMGRHDRAIEIYQRLLEGADAPLRVRLELADTFVEANDDRSAEHNYRLALASDEAETVREGVEARLKEIAERRRWRYSVNLAVSPDSNVNTATDARQLEIFGLPFELSDEARRTSGVGLSLAASAERSVPLKGRTRLMVGGYGRFVDNDEQAFDDGALGLRAGPQFWLGQTRAGVEASVERRWFGGQPLSRTAGLSGDLQWGWGRVQRHATLSAQKLTYDRIEGRDAWIYAAGWDRTRYVSANRFWRLGVSGARGEAETASESFWLWRTSAGLYQTLPAGLAAFVEPSVERRAYDARSLLSPKARRDTEYALAVRLIKRDWRYRGFSPYVGAQASRNDSNLDINAYSRLRVDFGATRTF